MKGRLIGVGLAALIALGACGDSLPGTPGSSESYPEGSVAISVSMLDVGLLKGDASAEAGEGWRVTGLKVTAIDPRGASWSVLEFPEGAGSRSVSEFFEVVLQELARGDQLEVTATATFQDDAGQGVQRQATDRWPP